MAQLNHPADLRYSKTDEWVRVEGDLAYIGISDYAQDQLGDIVNVELQTSSGTVRADRPFGNIDSVKASSELVSPVTGEVVQTNDRLLTEPEIINADPYGDGWLLTVRLADPAELDALLSGDQYVAYLGERSH